MKKHLLLLAFALIVFSAAPVMAGKKLTVRIYGQRSPYKVQWKRTQCDCVYHCDHLPGGTIRPNDMWPDGQHSAAEVESKDSSTHMDYCASSPSRIRLEFTNLSDPNDKTVGTVDLAKSTGAWGPHWHKDGPCGDTKNLGIYCTLTEGSTDNLDIRLIPLPASTSKQPAKAPTAVDTNPYYRLTTEFRGAGESLEGNRADSPVHSGAAFMDKRQNVSGQLWKLVPDGEWYRLKTQFQGDDRCLEGNRADSPAHAGAAFLDTCQNVSGQLWKLEPDGEWFRLKTQFQGDDRCLEGNRADSPVHDGAAFLDSCQNVSGQRWKLEPVK